MLLTHEDTCSFLPVAPWFLLGTDTRGARMDGQTSTQRRSSPRQRRKPTQRVARERLAAASRCPLLPKEILQFLETPNPNSTQLGLIRALLLSIVVRVDLFLDDRLSRREQDCLLMAA